MKISFCELLMFGMFGIMITTLVLAICIPGIVSLFYKLKENRTGRIGMWVAVPAACCLIVLITSKVIPASGIQLVDCTQKEKSVVTTALATVSLPCPCGCGKHPSN